MLREVINSGTGTRAQALKRPLAGKTGTTNDFADGWFIGFSPSLTCGVWVGYDDHRELGPKEEGARVALPIWMEFMGEALKDQPVEDFPHSPLLKDPEQVKEILASAGAERLLAERAAPTPADSQSPGVLPTRGPSSPATPRESRLEPAPTPASSAPGSAQPPSQSPATAPAKKSPPAPGKPSGSPGESKPITKPG
jgi:penicillin-binding protein 1A